MAELGFDGRVVVVTGAGRGLGREHALLFARRGARVVVNDIGAALDGTDPAEEPAAAVVAEIEALGGEAVADSHSVATPDGGAAIVEAAVRAFGRVDVVVNNAGILRDKSFGNLTPDLVDPVIDVHLRGAFHVTRAAWPHFREQGSGRVVNVTSNSGIFGNFGQAAYGAAKMGLVGLTHVLAIEGAKYDIKANAIAPVAITRMTEPIFAADLSAMVRPGLVSPVVVWLGHESCSVTGEVFAAGGGRVAKVVIAETVGYTNRELTVEDVRDHLDVIRDEHGYLVPTTASEEVALFRREISKA